MFRMPNKKLGQQTNKKDNKRATRHLSDLAVQQFLLQVEWKCCQQIHQHKLERKFEKLPKKKSNAQMVKTKFHEHIHTNDCSLQRIRWLKDIRLLLLFSHPFNKIVQDQGPGKFWIIVIKLWKTYLCRDRHLHVSQIQKKKNGFMESTEKQTVEKLMVP